MKSNSALFKWTNTGGQLGPLPHHFFPKSSDQNFDMVFFFSIVDTHNNYVFRDKMTPYNPWGMVLSYKIYPFFVCYWNLYMFLGWGGEDDFSSGRICHGENYLWRENFQGVDFSREVLHWVNLPEFLYKISLYVLLSLYRFNFRCGNFYLDWIAPRIFLWGGGLFRKDEARYPGFIQKRSEIKFYKTSFFQLKVMINLKN